MKAIGLTVSLALAASIGMLVFAQTPESVPPAFERAAAPADNDDSRNPGDNDPFDPDAFAPKMIQVQVEFLELSHEALTKLLLAAKPTTADATKLRLQVQNMVTKHEAKVLETQLIVAKHGQKSTFESIHEFIYPQEANVPMIAPSPEGTKPQPLTPLPTSVLPFIPSSFETRNLGSTVEIEPSISDNAKVIELRFVPELTWHTGNTTWVEYKDPHGNVHKVQTPDIYCFRLNTSLGCVSGQYVLAGAASPKDAKGDTDPTRKVMVFVKCDILSVR